MFCVSGFRPITIGVMLISVPSWTCSSTRSFCGDVEGSFVIAVTNSIMAEATRLNVLNGVFPIPIQALILTCSSRQSQERVYIIDISRAAVTTARDPRQRRVPQGIQQRFLPKVIHRHHHILRDNSSRYNQPCSRIPETDPALRSEHLGRRINISSREQAA